MKTTIRKTGVRRILGKILFAIFMLASTLVITRIEPAHANEASDNEIEVFHLTSCGCCRTWIMYLKGNGFTVKDTEVDDVTPIKEKFRIPNEASACHTAVIGDYVIEGHVSVEEILRLLKEKPDILGLAVPGMPPGAPGMEGPDPQPYKVFALQKDGTTTEFASHDP